MAAIPFPCNGLLLYCANIPTVLLMFFKGKKDLVKDILISNKIDILAMQEIEIESGFDEKTLSIPGYILETENNDLKKRTGFYISTSVKYSRKNNLEGRNNHLVVTCYRS